MPDNFVNKINVDGTDYDVQDSMAQTRISTLGVEMNGKVDIYQGTANAGKALVVGDGGLVAPTTIDAGNVPYNSSTTYTSGSIGAGVSDLKSAIFVREQHDFSSDTLEMWTITSGNKWGHVATASSRCYVISVKNTQFMRVTAGANGAIIAFLKSFNPVHNETPDFAGDYTARISLNAGDTEDYTVPADANYFYALAINTSNANMTPNVLMEYMKTDESLTQQHIPADSYAVGTLGNELVDAHVGYDGHIYSSVGNAMRGQFEGFVTATNYDFSTETLSAYTLLATGKWTHSTTGSSRSYTVRIPPNAASCKITAGANGGVVAFFSDYEYPPTTGTLPDYTDGTSRIPLTANEVAAYTIVPGMNYLYVAAVNSSGTNVLPTVTMYIAKGSGNGGGGNTVINNTYNITTNPTITTDTNGWLQAVDTESQSETGKTDMTGPIMSMLQDTGYCHLSEGIFYVSGNIEMPANSKIEGCGFGTKIKLLDGIDATAIVMDTHCSIENLWISGSYSTLTLDGVIAARNAISYAKSTNRYGVVSNCKISGFTGAGILLMDTSTPVDKCACVSNSFIENCNVGIYIRRNSEFNKIVNCTIVRNYYGYFNRGGNNDIANCGIDANVVNVQIDDDEGTNGGHGTITGCSMNHANNNTGYGLIVRGTGRMIVTNCNLYYAKIRLENTNGNVISNCGFGRSAGWEISGGECSMFIGCMIRSSEDTPITISNNTDVKVINCFDRDGNSVTIS